MRRLLILIALAMAGCGGDKFATESEELSYLSALSDPSPGQWKRRQELRAKAVAATKKAEDELAGERGRQAEILEAARVVTDRRAAEREAAARRKVEIKEIAEAFARAAKYEQQGEPGLASRCYRDVALKYPDAPEAATAREKAADNHRKAYRFPD